MKRSARSRNASSSRLVGGASVDIGCLGYGARAGADDHNRAAHAAARHHGAGSRGDRVASGAPAVLVYVPHTTAGLTINEHADPLVARDFEMALERIAPEGWGWQHIEEGEENAPSHIRAALMGPQVLIPLPRAASSRSAPGRASSSASSTARARARSTSPCLPEHVRPVPSSRVAAPVQRDQELELDDRLARLRRERRRAARRLRRLRPARPAGRHGARARDEGAAPPRRGDRHRGPRPPGRNASTRRVSTTRPAAAAASRISPTRHSSRRRNAGSATRCSASPASPSFRSSRSCPPSRSSTTATRWSTRSRRRTDGHARPAQGRPLGRGARDREVLAQLRPRQRDSQPHARVGAGGEAVRLQPGDARGLPASPRRPRRAKHRPGARAARDGPRRTVRPRAVDRGADGVPRDRARSTGR